MCTPGGFTNEASCFVNSIAKKPDNKAGRLFCFVFGPRKHWVLQSRRSGLFCSKILRTTVPVSIGLMGCVKSTIPVSAVHVPGTSGILSNLYVVDFFSVTGSKPLPLHNLHIYTFEMAGLCGRMHASQQVNRRPTSLWTKMSLYTLPWTKLSHADLLGQFCPS